MILNSQQRFRSEKHNVFTEEVNKIALNANDYKRTQSTDLLETHAYGTNEEIILEKRRIFVYQYNETT